MCGDLPPVKQAGWSHSINAGTDGSNSPRIVYAFQDPGSYLIPNLRTSNPATSGDNDRIKNRCCTQRLPCFEHEAAFRAESMRKYTDRMDLITWDAIAIAVVQSSCYKDVGGAYQVQRGNFVEAHETNAYRAEDGSTLGRTLHLECEDTVLPAMRLRDPDDQTDLRVQPQSQR